MKRLSSRKAKKALELLICKKLGASSIELAFVPYFPHNTLCSSNANDVLCEMKAIISFKDGNGCRECTSCLSISPRKSISSIIKSQYCPYPQYAKLLQRGASFAKMLRFIEKETSNGAIVYVAGKPVFTKDDSIEAALVECDFGG